MATRQDIFKAMQKQAQLRGQDYYRDIEAILEQYIRDAQAEALEESAAVLTSPGSREYRDWLLMRAHAIRTGTLDDYNFNEADA